MDTPIKLHFSGNLTWLAPMQFKSECKINVKFFPFDHQVCDLEFGSWTYNGHYIDINPLSKQLNFSQLVENPGWHIVDVFVMKKVDYYHDPYPTVIFRFIMKRRILYYLTNLLIPCILISFLSFLSFCLPVQSGERIALVITTLLSMSVYMILISTFMPPTSAVIPLMSKFYLACIIEIALCLVATFLTIGWYYNETPIPKWIDLLVNKYLGNALLFQKFQCKTSNSSLNCTKGNGGHDALRENDVLSEEDGMELEQMISRPGVKQEHPMFTESAKRLFARISDKIRQDEEMNGLRKKWKYASKVADRFFFFLFLALFLITVVFIIWNAADSEEEAYRKISLKSL